MNGRPKCGDTPVFLACKDGQSPGFRIVGLCFDSSPYKRVRDGLLVYRVAYVQAGWTLERLMVASIVVRVMVVAVDDEEKAITVDVTIFL